MSKKDFAEKYLKLKPITDAQKEYAKRNAARNIYIMDKKGYGFCGRCNKTVHIKAKHKEMVVCPHCKEKLMIQHTWRMSESQEEFRFLAIPQVLDSETYVIRYVWASRRPRRRDFVMPFKDGVKGTPWEVEEVARIYGTEKYSQPVYYVKNTIWSEGYKTFTEGWKQGRTDWFRPDTYSILCQNRHWVDYSDIYPRNLYRNLDKLDCFKYYSSKNMLALDDNVRNLQFCVRTARISEKLDKCGLKFLIKENHKHYWNCNGYYNQVPWFSGNKSIQETLKMNRWQINLLKKVPTMSAFKYLQNNPNASEEMFNKAACIGFNSSFESFVKKYGIKYGKTFQYIAKNTKAMNNNGKEINAFIIDYMDYVRTIDELGYPLDNSYLYPKNFREKDEEVQSRMKERTARRANMSKLEQVAEEAKIDETINKISKLLLNTPAIKEYLKGSNGLKVVVPQSVGEITDEGIHLHNCLQKTYYKRAIADKQTLIFFIRKIDEPDKSYISMEYKNGKIEQLRWDQNEEVNDTKIIDFAQHLVNRLNQLDIMNEIRRAA